MKLRLFILLTILLATLAPAQPVQAQNIYCERRLFRITPQGQDFESELQLQVITGTPALPEAETPFQAITLEYIYEQMPQIREGRLDILVHFPKPYKFVTANLVFLADQLLADRLVTAELLGYVDTGDNIAFRRNVAFWS